MKDNPRGTRCPPGRRPQSANYSGAAWRKIPSGVCRPSARRGSPSKRLSQVSRRGKPDSERLRSLWPVVAAVAAVAALAAGTRAVMHFRETPPPERILRYTIDLARKDHRPYFRAFPDGRNLAIAAINSEGKRQLWVRPLDSSRPRLSRAPMMPCTPSGRPTAAYRFFRSGQAEEDSCRGVPGARPAQTLWTAADGRGGAWNRDGVIVFAPLPIGGLQRVPAAGGVPAEVDEARTRPIAFQFFCPTAATFST